MPLFWLTLARFCSLTGDNILTFVVPIAVYRRTSSITLSGISFFVEWLPRVLLLPALGTFVDRQALRRQLLTLDVVRLSVTVLLGGLDGRLAWMIVLLAVVTLLNGYAFVLQEKIIARYVKERVVRFQARFQAVDTLAQMVGPALGGALLSRGTWALAVAVMVCFAGSLAIGMCSFREQSHPGVLLPIPEPSEPSKITAGFRVFWHSPALKRLVIITMAVNYVEGVCLALVPAVFLGQFEARPASVGLLMGGASALNVLILLTVSSALGKEHLPHVAISSGVGLIGCAVLMATAPSVAPFCAGFVGYIVSRSSFTVYMRTERLKLIAQEHYGRAIALIVSLLLIPLPLAGATVSVLGNVLKPQAIIWLGLSVSLATVAIVALLYRRVAWGQPEKSCPACLSDRRF